jgi:hypothetical protein
MGLAMSLALMSAGCGDGGDDEEATTATSTTQPATTRAPEAPRLADQWAGSVQDTNSYISVFTLTDGQTGAYLADGDRTAVLALGTLTGGQLALQARDGTRVTGNVSGDQVQGTVTLQGRDHAFRAVRATGEAGWYRARQPVGGETVAAGYIVLADGTQRGAVRRGDAVLATPRFDPKYPTIEVEGVGTLTLLPVRQFVEREGGIA